MITEKALDGVKAAKCAIKAPSNPFLSHHHPCYQSKTSLLTFNKLIKQSKTLTVTLMKLFNVLLIQWNLQKNSFQKHMTLRWEENNPSKRRKKMRTKTYSDKTMSSSNLFRVFCMHRSNDCGGIIRVCGAGF